MWYLPLCVALWTHKHRCHPYFVYTQNQNLTLMNRAKYRAQCATFRFNIAIIATMPDCDIIWIELYMI